MNAVNAVLLFFLVWTSAAVCQPDIGDCSASCDDVTGTVGKEVTFTCNISKECSECCIIMYKFQYPEIFNYSAICKEESPENTCEQRNSFTYRYTPTKAMTGKFRLFVQAKCGMKGNAEFTVVITETPKAEESKNNKSKDAESKDTESEVTVISSVVGCSVIIILIVILITIIYKKQYFAFQNRMFLCIKQNDDSSNCPENVI
ncbi:uncharacterized protein [Garra rufa]|uniref:uncharacterized protein n=1 Tax=Garra rufa TaxID=137080 RepID=UPI003CCE8F98